MNSMFSVMFDTQRSEDTRLRWMLMVFARMTMYVSLQTSAGWILKGRKEKCSQLRLPVEPSIPQTSSMAMKIALNRNKIVR